MGWQSREEISVLIVKGDYSMTASNYKFPERKPALQSFLIESLTGQSISTKVSVLPAQLESLEAEHFGQVILLPIGSMFYCNRDF